MTRYLRSDRAEILREKNDDCGYVDWEETVYVGCDLPCFALRDPSSEEELRAALEHWRSHGYLHGCSHGR